MRVRVAGLSRTLSSVAGGVALSLALPAAAHAHSGVGEATGLVHGALHPLTGIDHLLAMLAVGLWATQRWGRAIWVVPLAFLGVMTAGAALGMAGLSLPGVEPGIAASVLVLGLAVAMAVRMPLVASAALVGLFALFHGHAHGMEAPATASGLAYFVGFFVATAFLHAAGVGLGIVCQRLGRGTAVRVAGGAIAACGLGLCLLLF